MVWVGEGDFSPGFLFLFTIIKVVVFFFLKNPQFITRSNNIKINKQGVRVLPAIPKNLSLFFTSSLEDASWRLNQCLLCDSFALFAEVKERIVLYFVGTFCQDKTGKFPNRQMSPSYFPKGLIWLFLILLLM